MNGNSYCFLGCRPIVPREVLKLMVQEFINILKELSNLTFRYKILNTTPVQEGVYNH
jgi:hypothetical protein